MAPREAILAICSSAAGRSAASNPLRACVAAVREGLRDMPAGPSGSDTANSPGLDRARRTRTLEIGPPALLTQRTPCAHESPGGCHRERACDKRRVGDIHGVDVGHRETELARPFGLADEVLGALARVQGQSDGFSICSSSRPTASQWLRSTCSLWAGCTSGNRLQASAYWATKGSVRAARPPRRS